MTFEDHRQRSIRSFVRRSGRMTPAQKNAIAAHWSDFGIDYRDEWIKKPDKFDALKLEIGIGNGDALIEMASQDSSALYIGIEVHEPGIGRCLHQVHQRQLQNVRLIEHDAVEVLQHMVAPASVDRILLFFPDPWHKKRHHKRRIVNAAFRDLVARGLKPGGVIHVATDWQDYAEWIAEAFLNDDRFENLGDASGFAECPDYRPQTRFERRGLKLGHGVWDLLFAKK